MREGDAIADRDDARRVRRHRLVDEDSVVDGEARRGGDLGVRDDADAEEDEVGSDAHPGRGLDRDDPAALADDPSDRRVEQDGAAPTPVKLEKVTGYLRRDDAAHQPAGGFQHRHGPAQQPGGRGDLEADEPAADHDDMLRRRQPLAERPRLCGDAEDMDAGEVHAVDGGDPRAGAGGDAEPVERHHRTVGEADAAGREIDGLDLRGEHQADVVLLVERLGPERQEVVRGILEVGLGQGRALVGNVALRGDERQCAVIPLSPERGGELRAAVAAADDDDAVLEQGVLPCPVRGVA